MNKFVPILLVQDGILDSDGDLAFSFRCNNHYLHNGHFVLSSAGCDFASSVTNHDKTKLCRYFSTCGCTNNDAKEYILKCISKAIMRT